MFEIHTTLESESKPDSAHEEEKTDAQDALDSYLQDVRRRLFFISHIKQNNGKHNRLFFFPLMEAALWQSLRCCHLPQ